jgi:hypothetical protein
MQFAIPPSRRHSRARRIVENVFRILASRFGIFQRALSFDPDKVTAFVLASCALHNLLRSKTSSRKIYTPEGMFDNDDDLGELRTASRDSCFVNLVLQGGNRNNTLIFLIISWRNQLQNTSHEIILCQRNGENEKIEKEWFRNR